MTSLREHVKLSVPARAFEARLRGKGRRRLSLAELWEAFVALHPTVATDPDKRERLWETLEELAAARCLAFPAQASWERVPPPALPRFVTLSAGGSGPGRTRALDFPWHPELAWAATAQLSPTQRQFVERVNQFLADGGTRRPVIPLRERSLELCGDEKRLERLLDTALFAPGRLTLELLRAERVFEPFAAHRLNPRPLLLVVENATTYRTLSAYLPPNGAVGLVGFGRGWQFVTSIGSVPDVRPPVSQIRYFGDLDVNGLSIPVKATAVARSMALPVVQPAAGLYRLLLTHGTPSERSRDARHVTRGAASELACWLPTDLRTPVVELLSHGSRIAQEWVGADILRTMSHGDLDRLVTE
jgi:hypothetical protein